MYAQTVEARRVWRDLLVTSPGLGEGISGVIPHDETLRQRTRGGKPFASVLAEAGIVPGIKVDSGAKDLAGQAPEKVSEGLDRLRPATRPSLPMRMRWLATQRCARKAAWSRSSSPRW